MKQFPPFFPQFSCPFFWSDCHTVINHTGDRGRPLGRGGDLTDEWKHHFDYCTYPEVSPAGLSATPRLRGTPMADFTPSTICTTCGQPYSARNGESYGCEEHTEARIELGIAPEEEWSAAEAGAAVAAAPDQLDQEAGPTATATTQPTPALSSPPASSGASQIIARFSGTGTQNTPAFSTPSSWHLSWSYRACGTHYLSVNTEGCSWSLVPVTG